MVQSLSGTSFVVSGRVWSASLLQNTTRFTCPSQQSWGWVALKTVFYCDITHSIVLRWFYALRSFVFGTLPLLTGYWECILFVVCKTIVLAYHSDRGLLRRSFTDQAIPSLRYHSQSHIEPICSFAPINSQYQLFQSFCTTDQNLLTLPSITSEFGRYAFSYSAPLVLNNLPLSSVPQISLNVCCL